jgi:hypothetical protein
MPAMQSNAEQASKGDPQVTGKRAGDTVYFPRETRPTRQQGAQPGAFRIKIQPQAATWLQRPHQSPERSRSVVPLM